EVCWRQQLGETSRRSISAWTRSKSANITDAPYSAGSTRTVWSERRSSECDAYRAGLGFSKDQATARKGSARAGPRHAAARSTESPLLRLQREARSAYTSEQIGEQHDLKVEPRAQYKDGVEVQFCVKSSFNVLSLAEAMLLAIEKEISNRNAPI